MFTNRSNSSRGGKGVAILLVVLGMLLAAPANLYSAPVKVQARPKTAVKVPDKVKMDISKLVWPNPPSIARVKFLAFYAGMKFDANADTNKKKVKASWMDRLAGAQTKDATDIIKDFPFQLIGPAGIATDSKGLVYVADQRVGAVFIFNTETRDVQLIRNGFEAKFGWINSVAIDDSDRLFVSDAKLHRVVVFNAQHQQEGVIEDGIKDPVGMAVDVENRLLYVVDTQLDQVLVFDADSLRPLRRLGTGGKNHQLTTPGDFAEPYGVALDKDNNVYVTDTLNDRVEIFDADGKFISTFGKNGDGPGDFARPKGIAVDSDGHIWVMDQVTDRLQVFNRDGQLLTFLGGHGNYPGQFASGVGVYIDKLNRVFATDQYPGRLQMFRYITDSEAEGEKTRRQEAIEQKRDGKAAQKSAEPSTQSVQAKPAP